VLCSRPCPSAIVAPLWRANGAINRSAGKRATNSPERSPKHAVADHTVTQQCAADTSCYQSSFT